MHKTAPPTLEAQRQTKLEGLNSQIDGRPQTNGIFVFSLSPPSCAVHIPSGLAHDRGHVRTTGQAVDSAPSIAGRDSILVSLGHRPAGDRILFVLPPRPGRAFLLFFVEDGGRVDSRGTASLRDFVG
jgi:hypothetical protein